MAPFRGTYGGGQPAGADMNDGSRRAIAYVAGRLCTGRDAPGLFDPVAGRHIEFDGEVEPQVAVYDHSRNCLIGGTPRAVFDAGTRHYVNLVISGDSFTGFDHASEHHFGGRTDGGDIWMFDCEHDRRFNYVLVAPAQAPQEPTGDSLDPSTPVA